MQEMIGCEAGKNVCDIWRHLDCASVKTKGKKQRKKAKQTNMDTEYNFVHVVGSRNKNVHQVIGPLYTKYQVILPFRIKNG